MSPELVERIFERLAVRYGSQWTSKWVGIDRDLLVQDWCQELAGLERNPEAIRHALAHLPVEFPPTVAQFKALCISRPEPAPLALPAPHADPARVAKAIAEGRAAVRAPMGRGWAHALRAREEAGERLSAFQREAWRQELGVPA